MNGQKVFSYSAFCGGGMCFLNSADASCAAAIVARTASLPCSPRTARGNVMKHESVLCTTMRPTPAEKWWLSVVKS